MALLPVDQRGGLVDDLADVLAALHRPAPPDAPPNPYRGVPVAARDSAVRARILSWHGGPAPLLRAWAVGLDAPPHPGPPVWLHGDPHPLNLLQRDGRLTGLIDFGDVTAGDPAHDLATAWWTFGAGDRARFRARLAGHPAYDPAVWLRAAAWAASFASAMEPGTPLEPTAEHAALELAAEFS